MFTSVRAFEGTQEIDNPLAVYINPDNRTRQTQIASIVLDTSWRDSLSAGVDKLGQQRAKMHWRERMGVEPTEDATNAPQRS